MTSQEQQEAIEHFRRRQEEDKGLGCEVAFKVAIVAIGLGGVVVLWAMPGLFGIETIHQQQLYSIWLLVIVTVLQGLLR